MTSKSGSDSDRRVVAADGPWDLVHRLTSWAEGTPWVSWLELSGSLGRGAGDEHSDVDAGIGVSEPGRVDDVCAALADFAPIADSSREPFGEASVHVITVYADGRQLSLVVMPADARAGLPPQARALVDKNGCLRPTLEPSRWAPDAPRRRQWAFAACIAASDALKHPRRGNQWRALRSLNEARDTYLQLVAAREGVTFPQFGAVSLENAGRSIPASLSQTLPADLAAGSIEATVVTLMAHLEPFVAEHELGELARVLGLPAG